MNKAITITNEYLNKNNLIMEYFNYLWFSDYNQLWIKPGYTYGVAFRVLAGAAHDP